MTEKDRKFLESKQEAQKLHIALERFFETDSQEWKERYGSYLKMRIRPAMKELIADGLVVKIDKLHAYAGFGETSLNEFITEAQRQKKMHLWLSRRKNCWRAALFN